MSILTINQDALDKIKDIITKYSFTDFHNIPIKITNPTLIKELYTYTLLNDNILSVINLYLDDNILNTIDLTETINPTTEHGPKNPFQQPHYMLINLAIGGNQGGDPTTTLFPTSFEIDYVRVYQK